MSDKSHDRLIALGVISGAHGIRGEVKIRSFTAIAEDILSYGKLRDRKGNFYTIVIKGGTKDALIATIKGVTDRNGAELLRNTELFVPRAALPPASPGQYYHEDLIGLDLLTQSGEKYGTVAAMHNFGAGDLVGVKRQDGDEELLPFTDKIFNAIDFDKGSCIIAPPDIERDD